ncbi:hypothetical protein H9P43_003361 [Blastocladiella emersonii ATCC 22665]|nr:hypothetical protein H9P43_003361 [Blastocladiella emersonii ATCC 22665]
MIFDILTDQLAQYDAAADRLQYRDNVSMQRKIDSACNFARAASERLATGPVVIESDFWELKLSDKDRDLLTQVTKEALVGKWSVPFRRWHTWYNALFSTRGSNFLGRLAMLAEGAMSPLDSMNELANALLETQQLAAKPDHDRVNNNTTKVEPKTIARAKEGSCNVPLQALFFSKVKQLARAESVYVLKSTYGFPWFYDVDWDRNEFANEIKRDLLEL